MERVVASWECVNFTKVIIFIGEQSDTANLGVLDASIKMGVCVKS